jgi:hypothetical protein
MPPSDFVVGTGTGRQCEASALLDNQMYLSIYTLARLGRVKWGASFALIPHAYYVARQHVHQCAMIDHSIAKSVVHCTTRDGNGHILPEPDPLPYGSLPCARRSSNQR